MSLLIKTNTFKKLVYITGLIIILIILINKNIYSSVTNSCNEVLPGNIVIDGNLTENEWLYGDYFVLTNGYNELIYIKLLWNNIYLYVGFLVYDKTLWGDSYNSSELWRTWEDDTVEFYIDTLNNGGTTPQTDDYEFHADLSPYFTNGNAKNSWIDKGDGTTWVGIGTFQEKWLRAFYVNGTLNNSSDTDIYYSYEYAIPWTNIGGPPEVFEIDRITVIIGNDTNGGPDVENWTSPGVDRMNPNTWNWFIRYEPIIKSMKVDTNTVTVDGNLSEWSKANYIKLKCGNNNVYFYTMWDDKYLYYAFDVRDKYLWGDDYNPSSLEQTWVDDSVEFYLDRDHSRSNTIHNSVYEFAWDITAEYTNGQPKNGAIFYGNAGSWVLYGTPDWMKRAFSVKGRTNNNSDIDKEFIYEFGIPWTQIGISAPSNNQISGFYLVIGDDTNGGANVEIWGSPGGASDRMKPNTYLNLCYLTNRIDISNTKVIYVYKSQTNGPWNGFSWETAFTSITDALGLYSSGVGNTIYVSNGIYYETVFLNSTHKGILGYTNRIIGCGSNVILTGNNLKMWGFELEGADYNLIKNFNVTKYTDIGIHLLDSDFCSIISNTVYSNKHFNIELNKSTNCDILYNKTTDAITNDGIQVFNCNNINIKGNISCNNFLGVTVYSNSSEISVISNRIYNNRESGIWGIKSESIKVKGNMVYSNQKFGIQFQHCTNVNVRYNSSYYNNQFDGIQFDNTSSVTMIGNNAYNNFAYGITLYYCGDAKGVLKNNYSYSNGGNGIWIINSKNIVGVNNSIHNNGAGITLEFVTNISFQSNIIYNNTNSIWADGGYNIIHTDKFTNLFDIVFNNNADGIQIINSINGLIKNCDIISNDCGLYINSASANIELRNSIVAYNNYIGISNFSGAFTNDYSDVYGNGNNFFGCIGGAGTISQKPGFQSLQFSSSNFLRLRSTSPCIDAANPVDNAFPGYIGDYWDIGRYEFDYEIPVLRISKSLEKIELQNSYSEAIPGAIIQYIIKYENDGYIPAVNPTIIDFLSPNIIYKSNSATIMSSNHLFHTSAQGNGCIIEVFDGVNWVSDSGNYNPSTISRIRWRFTNEISAQENSETTDTMSKFDGTFPDSDAGILRFQVIVK